MTNSDNFETLFRAYISEAKNFLSGVPNQELVLKVDELERRESYANLKIATIKLAPRPWEWALFHYFRRTGVYFDLARNQESDYFEPGLFIRELNREKITQTSIIPILGVESSVSEDFDQFEITPFGKIDEIRNIDNENYRLFYPTDFNWSYLLSNCMSVVIRKDEIKMHPDPNQRFSLDSTFEVKRVTRDELNYIEVAKLSVLLLPWELVFNHEVADDIDIANIGNDLPWFRPDVNNGIVLNDSLLHHPYKISEYLEKSRQWTEPASIDNQEGYIIKHRKHCSHTNISDEHWPKMRIQLKSINRLLRIVSPHLAQWKFLDVAFDAFEKASSTNSELEQLLWHMVTIEALFGQKGSVSLSIKKRLLKIFEHNITRPDKLFDRLYNVRCDLAHGNVPDGNVNAGDILKARSLARKSIVWFLNYLTSVLKSSEEGNQSELPNRDSLLRILDYYNALTDVETEITNSLPSGFPSMSNWEVVEEQESESEDIL